MDPLFYKLVYYRSPSSQSDTIHLEAIPTLLLSHHSYVLDHMMYYYQQSDLHLLWMLYMSAFFCSSRTGEPGELHIAESHTYISDDSAASSDVDYDDDSTLHEVNV